MRGALTLLARLGPAIVTPYVDVTGLGPGGTKCRSCVDPIGRLTVACRAARDGHRRHSIINRDLWHNDCSEPMACVVWPACFRWIRRRSRAWARRWSACDRRARRCASSWAATRANPASGSRGSLPEALRPRAPRSRAPVSCPRRASPIYRARSISIWGSCCRRRTIPTATTASRSSPATARSSAKHDERLVEAAMDDRELDRGAARRTRRSLGGLRRAVPGACRAAAAGAGPLAGARLALDLANGATTATAVPLFTRLGFEVIAIGDRPDGRNINLECGSTHPANSGGDGRVAPLPPRHRVRRRRRPRDLRGRSRARRGRRRGAADAGAALQAPGATARRHGRRHGHEQHRPRHRAQGPWPRR